MSEALTYQQTDINFDAAEEDPLRNQMTKRNRTIDELIDDFCNGDPYPAIDAREELQQRFSAQSHQDQIKIIRTFLESVDDVDHKWCCETMQTWWDDCIIPDVKKAWETYREASETWWAMTDGMYGDYPGSMLDYDALVF